jgi:transcriptional regulator with XRE-family HTH domain
MKFFDEASLRLKQQLGVTQDQELAKVFGMSKRAWAGRKTTNNFPETELWALAARRPDLALDVGYVLNGVRGSRADEDKSLIEIIDRFLTVYNLNSQQADEALSLPAGTVAKALSSQLPAEPGHGARAVSLDEAALLDNYRHSPEEGKEAITRTAFALAKSAAMKKGAA